MRTIALITLTTMLACETTDAETEETTDDTTARQVPDGMTDFSEEEELAGGMPKHGDEFTWFENFENFESAEQQPTEWRAARVKTGVYMATIDEVYANECSPLKPGDEFGARVRKDAEGQTILNRGLLEADGHRLRYNRVKDAPLRDYEDCFVVEITDGMGTLEDNRTMQMDFKISVTLEGSDCPVADPCVDSYSTYLDYQPPLEDLIDDLHEFESPLD